MDNDHESSLAPDSVAGRLGIERVDQDADRLVLRMVVRDDMANLHGFLHGGVLLTLVDTVQGLLANDRGAMVTASVSTEFIRPAVVGAVLTATARRRHAGRSSAVFDIEVADQAGRLVALGQSRSMRIGEPPPPVSERLPG